MSLAMFRGIRSRIATAATLGAVATVFTLSVPAPAFAGPELDDCQVDPDLPGCQRMGTDIPTGPDDARCVGMPTAIGCEGGRFDDDDNNNWPYFDDPMW
jgi:hypothetical protein